ncbi:MAG: esterase family protein [Lentisphaeria bacterium]|nr:esterase family protein [Lentisphaeria bacterium]
MALFESHFFSESLGMCVSANIVLPQTTRSQIGLKGVGSPDGCPVLYLLHGLSDDHTIWLRRTSVERYAAQYGIAVVMPNVHRSYYSDTAGGLRYWEYVSRELPEFIGSTFRVSQKPEDTYAAGLSMGGFGAMKLALNCPERFAAAGGFSSAIGPCELAAHIPERKKEFDSIFGSLDNVPGSINDLFAVAEKAVQEKKVLPRLYLECGTEDFLWNENVRFKEHLEKLKIPFTWKERPGTHGWDFWDVCIQNFLRFAFRDR